MDNELTAVIAEMREEANAYGSRDISQGQVDDWADRLEAIAARSAREARILAAADAYRLALVERWRTISGGHRGNDFDQCAAELSALLSAPAPVDMTIERAVEVLNREGWMYHNKWKSTGTNGKEWATAVAIEESDTGRQSLIGFVAIAIAEKLEREAYTRKEATDAK